MKKIIGYTILVVVFTALAILIALATCWWAPLALYAALGLLVLGAHLTS
jgi:hypothetical protein